MLSRGKHPIPVFAWARLTWIRASIFDFSICYLLPLQSSYCSHRTRVIFDQHCGISVNPFNFLGQIRIVGFGKNSLTSAPSVYHVISTFHILEKLTMIWSLLLPKSYPTTLRTFGLDSRSSHAHSDPIASCPGISSRNRLANFDSHSENQRCILPRYSISPE